MVGCDGLWNHKKKTVVGIFVRIEALVPAIYFLQNGIDIGGGIYISELYHHYLISLSGPQI